MRLAPRTEAVATVGLVVGSADDSGGDSRDGGCCSYRCPAVLGWTCAARQSAGFPRPRGVARHPRSRRVSSRVAGTAGSVGWGAIRCQRIGGGYNSYCFIHVNFYDKKN